MIIEGCDRVDQLLNVTLYILKGTTFTLQLYAVTMLFSIPLGLLGALGKVVKVKPLNGFMEFYTWIFRGTPLMLQLFFAYYGLPMFEIRLSAFAVAALTFSLNYGAYFTEIFRSGIQSIDKGQYEAAKVIGMSYTQTMRRIILPQAFKRVIPPTCSEAINLVKDTALVIIIGLQDLLKATKEVVSRDFTIYPFFIAVAIYLLLTFVIVYLFKALEKKYSVYE
jgi:polar amino acid transport system permease protein